MKRRKFVQSTSLASLAFLLSCKQKAEEKVNKNTQTENLSSPEIGIQLYTVRDMMNENPIATLEAISKVGYNSVEAAGYETGKFYGIEPKEFKKVLDDNGLKMVSGHCGTGFTAPDRKGTMYNDFQKMVDDSAEVGMEYLVLAYLVEEERTKLDDYKRLVDKINECGAACKKSNIQFAYHNHDFEFIALENKIPYDLLLSISPEHLKMELDLYWVQFAGQSAKEIFEKNPGRFPLWHVKDMDKTEERFFTEVGNGIIDFKSIFEMQKISGMKHFYVEQDQCKNHKPIESVSISYNYVSKNLV